MYARGCAGTSRAEPGAATTSLRLAGLDAAAHAALCPLTGRPSRTARSMILDIADLDARWRAAQRAVLDQRTAAGAHLQYHGDYDWAGIAIGNLVMRTWNAVPWRFCAADYLLAVGRCSTARHHCLGIATVEASWDP